MTGALMPIPITRPVSVVSTVSFLAVGIWANHHKEGRLELLEICLFMLAFLAGAFGRYHMPTCQPTLRLLAYLGLIKIGSQAKSKCGKKLIQAQCTCGNFYMA